MKLPKMSQPLQREENRRQATEPVSLQSVVSPSGKCCGSDERCIGPCVCVLGSCSCAGQCVPW